MTNISATDEHIRDLIRAIIALSPYRRALQPMVDDVVRVALVNDQIRTALERIAKRSSFEVTHRVRKGDLGHDRAALFMFLEHIRFAAPTFLASVGETRMGGCPLG